ncbi:COG1573 Uracil-DNA glycosylase [Oxalobacteraceae bacterium]
MNPEKLVRLERMGLGPVWKLRAYADESVSETATDFATDFSALDWDELEATIRECARCGLCRGRTHAVPGIGARNASWLFVGEGPGRNEDLAGEPFIGPAGKLLDNMLKSLQLARGVDTYIANIVKCRPVDADGRDRPPVLSEVATCRPFLERQIDLIKPTVIVALGKTASISLLGLNEETSLASLRGESHSYQGIPVVVTYHPAYLLSKPEDKAKSWRDLCLAQSLHDER